MTIRHSWLAPLLILMNLALSPASAKSLSVPFVVAAADRTAYVRIVVEDSTNCPQVRVDGALRRMSLRGPVPKGMQPVCELLIPGGAKRAELDRQILPLPRSNPSRIVVFGDSGCRVQAGREVQDCSNPERWPLAKIAARAAAMKPDLVIHVGDYVYRGAECPTDKQALCEGSPFGERWETWDADFFRPSAKLLAAAPWVFVRGNAEGCDTDGGTARRAFWLPWLYYLDASPWTEGECRVYTQPYIVRLGRFKLAVFDSANVQGRMNQEQITTYSAQLRSLTARGIWLADHHPFWPLPGSEVFPAGAVGPSGPLQQSWELSSLSGVDVVLSGHVHNFQLLGLDERHPVQIVAGTGGNLLNPAAPSAPPGSQIGSAAVRLSEIKSEFGYVAFTRKKAKWILAFMTPAGTVRLLCDLQGRSVKCQ